MLFFENKDVFLMKNNYFLSEKTPSSAIDLSFALTPFISDCKKFKSISFSFKLMRLIKTCSVEACQPLVFYKKISNTYLGIFDDTALFF